MYGKLDRLSCHCISMSQYADPFKTWVCHLNKENNTGRLWHWPILCGLWWLHEVTDLFHYTLEHSFFPWISSPRVSTQFLNCINHLRAPLSNFHLRLCKIKKPKIAKLCQNKGLPKPFLEKYVLVCFDNYFTRTATFSVWGLVSEWKRLQNVACLNRYFLNNEWVTWKSKQHGTARVIHAPFSAVNGTI